ncbi:hypothetical protein [Succinimonas sp.]|uniref:hypothetical protein n=1 Tax=Succinimonas sp. TaxID=1936151 RepID=UPI00386B6439
MNRNSAAQKLHTVFRKAGFWISGRGCGIEEKLKSKLTGKKTGMWTWKQKVAVMEKLTKPGKMQLKINRKDIAG